MNIHRLSLIALMLFAGLAARAQDLRDSRQFEVLVFAQPEKWHQECVPAVHAAFEGLSKHHQFGLTWSEDPAVFAETNLARFAVIVFVNCTGATLDEAQRANFTAYIHGGGNFVAVHGTTAARQGWPWFNRLIGRAFLLHPYVQSAVVRVTDRNFPATFALPDRWVWTDEWYEFGPPLVPDLHTVLRVDETTYDPRRIWPDQKAEGMGADHPVAWYHTFEGGRVFVTMLGHMPSLFADTLYVEHLYGGLYWAATGRGVEAPVAKCESK